MNNASRRKPIKYPCPSCGGDTNGKRMCRSCGIDVTKVTISPTSEKQNEPIIKLLECSVCGGKISINAEVCPHCGEPSIDQDQINDFITTEKKPFLDHAGLNFLILIGFIGAIYFLIFFDTSVTSPMGRINNLGLMQDRQNYMLFFGALGIIALIIKFNRAKK